MFLAVKRHSLVDIMMLNTMRCFGLDLMEQLVILVLDIAHQFLTLVMSHIVVVIPLTVIIKALMLVIITLDLATMV